MDRRRFLTCIGAGSVLAVSGCSEYELRRKNPENEPTVESGVDPDSLDPLPAAQVQARLQANPQLISVNEPATDRFTATLQNEGTGGNIEAALFWQLSEDATEPTGIYQDGLNQIEDLLNWSRERIKSVYFNSGERRTIEFVATPPSDAIAFLIIAEPATYGAEVHNEGGAGNITVTLKYAEEPEEDVSPIVDHQDVYIDQGQTREVLFDTVLRYSDVEWEVIANGPLKK